MIVVKRFTLIAVAAHAHSEQINGLLHGVERAVDHLAPIGVKFRVASLQLHQILLGRRDHFISALILSFQFSVAMRSRKESTGGFRTPPIGLGVGLSFAVRRVKILEGDLIQIDTVVSKLGQDQSDGCSPITKVVLTDHRPPPPFQSSGNGITNNG